MLGNRRQFLRDSTGFLGVAGLVGPLAFLQTKKSAHAADDVFGTRGKSPYGPVSPVKDLATGLPLLMLPPNFSYYSLSWKGDTMSDGNLVPSGHDGMAVVSSNKDGRATDLYLIRNHEVFGLGTPIAPDHNYDARGPAGTSFLVWRDGVLRHSGISISGTSSNCAGGKSPWGTWCTCEEGVDQGDQPHGYVYECTTSRVTNPTPLKSMGRLPHEALAFDPRNGYVYLTEDNSTNAPSTEAPTNRRRGQSGFYRFVPNAPNGGLGSLEQGGTLYMCRALDPATGDPALDLRDPPAFGAYKVEWVKIDVPDSPPVPARGASGPYVQGRDSDKGATRFQRLEGCWWSDKQKVIYFADTEGGPIGAQPGNSDRAEGAVWRYDPEAQTLTAIFVSQGAKIANAYGSDNPDNLSVSPRGGVILCEDGGQDDGNGLSMLGLLPNGQSYEFCRNNIVILSSADIAKVAAAGHNPAAGLTGDFRGQEFAGATFDPTGRYLFVNVQTPGITFVIAGPWATGNL